MSIRTKLFVLLTISLGLFAQATAFAEIKPTGRQKKPTTNLRLTQSNTVPLLQQVKEKAYPTPTKAPIAGPIKSASNTGDLVIATTEIPTSDSISFNFSTNNVTLARGESATINVTVNADAEWLNGNQPKHFFLAISEEPEGVQATASRVLASTAGFSIEVTAGPNAEIGSHTLTLFALHLETNSSQSYTVDHNFTVNIEEAVGMDPADNLAEIQVGQLADADYGLYTNGWLTVTDSFAMIDSNSNGIIDAATGANNTPFPGFPVAGGGANAGRAYANPHGTRANIVVAAKYGTSEWIALHLYLDNNGIMTPVQALIGDIATGEIMIQDASGWTYEFNGSLPTGNLNGFLAGQISFTPFFFDAESNTIVGNTIEFSFDMALENDN